jgi:hypothetical protein
MTAPRQYSPTPMAPPRAHSRVIDLGGQAVYNFQFAAPHELVFAYFCDIPAVFSLLPDTLDMRAYGPDRYRLVIGASDGHGHSMSAIFDLAAHIQAGRSIYVEPSNDGPPPNLPGIVFHGNLWAEATFHEGVQSSSVEYSVEIEMSIPIPGVLKLMPQHFLQTLGEKTMAFKMGQMINGFARNIHSDFAAWAGEIENRK